MVSKHYITFFSESPIEELELDLTDQDLLAMPKYKIRVKLREVRKIEALLNNNSSLNRDEIYNLQRNLAYTFLELGNLCETIDDIIAAREYWVKSEFRYSLLDRSFAETCHLMYVKIKRVQHLTHRNQMEDFFSALKTDYSNFLLKDEIPENEVEYFSHVNQLLITLLWKWANFCKDNRNYQAEENYLFYIGALIGRPNNVSVQSRLQILQALCMRLIESDKVEAASGVYLILSSQDEDYLRRQFDAVMELGYVFIKKSFINKDINLFRKCSDYLIKLYQYHAYSEKRDLYYIHMLNIAYMKAAMQDYDYALVMLRAIFKFLEEQGNDRILLKKLSDIAILLLENTRDAMSLQILHNIRQLYLLLDGQNDNKLVGLKAFITLYYFDKLYEFDEYDELKTELGSYNMEEEKNTWFAGLIRNKAEELQHLLVKPQQAPSDAPSSVSELIQTSSIIFNTSNPNSSGHIEDSTVYAPNI